MLAFLFLAGAFGLVEGGEHVREHPTRHVRRARARAARVPRRRAATRVCARRRSATCCSSSRTNPAPPTSAPRWPARCATRRSSSRTGCPTSRSYADLDGRPVELPDRATLGRAITEVDRDGAPVAVLLHDPSLLDEPELLEAVAATAGIALENARLQSDLRARGRRARRVARPGAARRADANVSAWNATCTTVRSSGWSRSRSTSADSSTSSPTPTPTPATVSSSARASGGGVARRAAHLARGLHPAVVSAHGLAGRARRARGARRGTGRRCRSTSTNACPNRSRSPRTTSCRRASPTSASTRTPTAASVAVTRDRDHVVVEVVDDGIGGADTERGYGSARARRPRRGARRPPAHLDAAGWRHPCARGGAVRVVIAEDSVLLRDGFERLLDDHGFEVVGSCEDVDRLLELVRTRDARGRDRRHPPSADALRRRAAGRAHDPGRPSRASACSCCRSTSSWGWP